MQFQVPQFIETEDKIVGPLTLRQFLYIGAAAGASFLLFFLLKPWLWFLVSLILVGLGAAMAFVKINGRSFIEIVTSALKFYWKPQTFVWKPKEKTRKQPQRSAEPRSSFSLESLAQGAALKRTWQKLQTAKSDLRSEKDKKTKKVRERYQIFEKLTGERQAARRVDYR